METFKRKRMGQTAVSDNQSSSVTLNELEKEARKIYCNFEFQRRSLINCKNESSVASTETALGVKKHKSISLIICESENSVASVKTVLGV